MSRKKAAAKKENEAHDTRNNAKDKMERKNAAAAAEAESTLVETVAQETEGRSTKRSSKAGNQRVVLLITSIDEVMMNRIAVSVIRLQESDCRTNAHTHS